MSATQRYIKAVNYVYSLQSWPSKNEFYEYAGLTPFNYSAMKRGRQKVSIGMLERLAEIAPSINFNYIITGKGPMMADNEQIEEFVRLLSAAIHSRQHRETIRNLLTRIVS